MPKLSVKSQIQLRREEPYRRAVAQYELILAQDVNADPDDAAAAFVDDEKGVADVNAALAGARDIVAETVAENADVRGLVRQAFATQGVVASEVVDPKPTEPTKFEQYYEFSERLSDIPSHRFLAIRRGQTEGVLRVRVACEADPLLERISEMVALNPSSRFAPHLKEAIEDSYKRLIAPSVEVDVMVETKMKADRAAVEIQALFATAVCEVAARQQGPALHLPAVKHKIHRANDAARLRSPELSFS